MKYSCTICFLYFRLKISPNGNATTRRRCPRDLEQVLWYFGVSGHQVGTVIWLVVQIWVWIKTSSATTLKPTALCPDQNVRELPVSVLGFHKHCRNGQFLLSLVLLFGCLGAPLPPNLYKGCSARSNRIVWDHLKQIGICSILTCMFFFGVIFLNFTFITIILILYS